MTNIYLNVKWGYWHDMGLEVTVLQNIVNVSFIQDHFLILYFNQLHQKWKLHQYSALIVLIYIWEGIFKESPFIGWHVSVIDFQVASLTTLKWGFYTSSFSTMGTFHSQQKWPMTSVLSLCRFTDKIWKKY